MEWSDLTAVDPRAADFQFRVSEPRDRSTERIVRAIVDPNLGAKTLVNVIGPYVSGVTQWKNVGL